MQNQPINKCKLCKSCPANKEDGNPSGSALNSIYALQTKDITIDNLEQKKNQCEWYINSSDHDYCFWKYAREIDGSTASDKEICNLLLMTNKELKETLASALKKLKNEYDSGEPDVIEFIELLTDKVVSQYQAVEVCIPGTLKGLFCSVVIDSDETDDAVDIKKKPGRKPQVMPLHRNGKKCDLYGLYSPKKLEEIKQKMIDNRIRKRKRKNKKKQENQDISNDNKSGKRSKPATKKTR